MEKLNVEEAALLLGVPLSATLQAVERAYRKQSFLVHPDRHDNDPETQAAMASKFIKVSRAKKVMMARASQKAASELATPNPTPTASNASSARSSVCETDVPTSCARISHHPSSDFPVGEIADLPPRQVTNLSSTTDARANIGGTPSDSDDARICTGTPAGATHDVKRKASTKAHVGSPGRSDEHAPPPTFPSVVRKKNTASPSYTTTNAEPSKEPQSHSHKPMLQIPKALRRGAPYRCNSRASSMHGEAATDAGVPAPHYIRPSFDVGSSAPTVTTASEQGDGSPTTTAYETGESLFSTADTAESPRACSPPSPFSIQRPRVNTAFRLKATPHSLYARNV
eukprot:GEMP01036070.1.p1 GENE.GEMP01036070.1~~GEMP01036070.1.p1  ORF type:complete len:341 (+),score=74.97 GEMP01036070.1:72-1094(+)